MKGNHILDELNLLNSNLDLSVLDNLSPEQRELALSILQEYAQTGDSEAYSKLILEDYAETPVDILTFVDDYNYLGNAWHDAEGNSKLYPYWRKELVKIFPDNFTTTVNNGIFSGSRGRGKEQPLSSLVLSEHGYITMGDVEVGTKVYGRDGQLHPVTAIYPQGVKDIYKITFSDNTSARCGLQHLWQVEKDGKSFTINIKQLLECSKNESLTNYYIPLCQPVDFAFNKNIDEAYMEGCDFALGKEILRTEARYSNINARIALLQGILDTRGEVAENCIKASVTPVQKEGILWLVHSLGGVALTKEATLKIFLPKSVQPFRSSKKLSQYNNVPHVQPYRRITSIEKLPYKEECQCIMVDSAEHLYITDNFIVTHNTEVALLIAAYLLHRILCLKDPIAYYHLKPTEKLVFAFMNIKLALAEEIGVSKFQNTLQSSPWFMAHGELEGRTKKIWVPQKYNNQVAIDIKIGSQADDLVGLPIFFCLSGDTPILTDKGTYDIESLENKIIRVPSVDDTGHIILSDECTVKQTAECDIEYSLELENGAIIKCTPTHRFKLADGSYKEVRYLTEEDELFGIASHTQNYKNIKPQIKSITVTHLATPKKYYDVVNANPYNNFLIDAGTGYICSHNCFFDEISFIKNQDVEKQKKKAYDMLNTAVGGMKTRFVHKGKNPTFLALASSKRSDKSFLEEHMKKKLKSEKDNVYISDGPVWEVKPAGTYSDKTFRVAVGNKFLSSLVIPDEDDEEPYIKKGYKIIYPPIDFKADFIDDIDRALCDFAGISSSSISKYINAAVVQSLITTRIKNPFTQEILKIGDGEDDEAQYYNFFDLSKVDPALKTKPLYIHMDMSYTGDKTGISGVYIAGKKPSNNELTQANDLFFSAAFSVSIEAPKGRHISFAKNRNFIYWLKEQGFNIKGITTDTYQSYDTGEQLRMKGYPYHVLSVDRVDSSKICIPYQYFKSTIYEKRLELFEDDLLFREITDLERNIETGKVDHPDGGCFTGDTEVALVDGRNANFLQLVDEYNQGRTNYVYSINLNTKKIEPKKIKKAWKTKENQPLIRITFDNQQSVECTLDHRFMLRNGSYVEAKDLQIGDSLMPLYTKYPQKGALRDYRMYYEPFEGAWHFEHRQFATEILDEKYLVHHKNHNKKDNSPDNLVWCSKKAHANMHARDQTGANSEKARKKKSKSLKEWHQVHRDTEAYEQRRCKTRATLNAFYLDKYGYNVAAEARKRIEDIEKFYDIRWDKLTPEERNSYGVKWAHTQDKGIKTRISVAIKELHEKGCYATAEEALQRSNESSHMLKLLFPSVDEYLFKELFGFPYASIEPQKRAPWVNRYRQKLYQIKNHKVIKVELLNKTADVYDIEVEDNHNFALAAGVFVHNSKDACDALAASIYNASTHAEEFAYDYGETSEQLLRLNEDHDLLDTQTLSAGLEEELKALGKSRMGLSQPPDLSSISNETYDYFDIPIL